MDITLIVTLAFIVIVIAIRMVVRDLPLEKYIKSPLVLKVLGFYKKANLLSRLFILFMALIALAMITYTIYELIHSQELLIRAWREIVMR